MLNIGEARDVQVFAQFVLGDNEITAEEQAEARSALLRLLERSHKVLGAGMTPAEAEAEWTELFDRDDERPVETVTVDEGLL